VCSSTTHREHDARLRAASLPSRATECMVFCLFARPDVRFADSCSPCPCKGPAVITFATKDYNLQRLQRRPGEIHVMAVSAVNDHCQRNAVCVSEQTALDAAFTATRRVATEFFPRKGELIIALSSASQEQLISRKATALSKPTSRTPLIR
jgi:hypothetical protein